MNANYKSIISAISLFFALSASISAAPGDLDPTFGNGGKVITDFNRVDYALAVALQPDGKLIVAGSSFNTTSPDFLIVRYNGDGGLDTSFGNGGKVTTDFGAQDYAVAVALQPDGKIVAAGLSQSPNIGNIVLARYNADGSLDSAFGGGGKVTTDFNGQYERADALVLQADGKLVTAGFTCGGGNCDLLLIRYNSNGSLDSTFGSGGKVTTDFNGHGVDSARALVLQPDGKIVAAGSVYLAAKSDFALARYNSNGTLDTTFGMGGIVTTDFGDSEDAGDVVIQPDGKIVAAGSFGDGDPDNDSFKFALARYNADGTLDATFGSGGKVLTGLGQSGHFTGLSGLALQADGKLVAAGGVRLFNGNLASVSENFALARYNSNGTHDTAFGTGGIVTTGFGVFVRASGGIVIQPDGKIVAAGYTIHEHPSNDIALARYVLDAPCPNPIDCADFFVRQHYLDFLSREPEAAGLQAWLGVLNGCPNPFNTDPNSPSAACDRIAVSAAFFNSPEFRLKGFYAFTSYRVAFNRRPTYEEIISDMQSLTGATPAEVHQRRAQFPFGFTNRPEFKSLYDALSDAAFVAALLDRYGLQQITTPDPADPEGGAKVGLTRADLIARLGGQALTRAQVLRAVVESEEVGAAEYNRAFVAMQYYGYLRRAPEEEGYQAWLRVINQDPQNVRLMVNGFINSTEYALRFRRP